MEADLFLKWRASLNSRKSLIQERLERLKKELERIDELNAALVEGKIPPIGLEFGLDDIASVTRGANTKRCIVGVHVSEDWIARCVPPCVVRVFSPFCPPFLAWATPSEGLLGPDKVEFEACEDAAKAIWQAIEREKYKRDAEEREQREQREYERLRAKYGG